MRERLRCSKCQSRSLASTRSTRKPSAALGHRQRAGELLPCPKTGFSHGSDERGLPANTAAHPSSRLAADVAQSMLVDDRRNSVVNPALGEVSRRGATALAAGEARHA
jgi:hypothetical protein